MRGRKLLEFHGIVKGKVQGVGFRATLKSCAERLKLVGFVRNLADGSVEICAQGEKAVLEKLLEKLQQEFGSDIRDISCDFRSPVKIFSDFKIL